MCGGIFLLTLSVLIAGSVIAALAGIKYQSNRTNGKEASSM